LDCAKDTYTNTIVDADHGTRSAHRYVCGNPRCGKRVYWSKGTRRRSAFVHWPGEGSPDCELFHGGNIESPPPQPLLPQPLGLYLSVIDPHITAPFWQLQLLVPPPPLSVTIGSVRITAGATGVVTVPLAHIDRVQGKRIAVKVQETSYRVDASDDIDVQYGRVVTVNTPGLALGSPTVFRYSDNHARRLPEKTPLRWGHAYYLVWHEHLRLRQPAGLSWWRTLQRRGAWWCAEVELPDEEDGVIRSWAESYLGCAILDPPLRPTLIAPVPIDHTTGDVHVIPAGHDVFVGISHERGVAMPAHVYVKRSLTGLVESVALRGPLPLVLSLGRAVVGDMTVFLGGIDDYLMLRVVDAPPPRALPQAHIVVTDITLATDLTVPVYSEGAAEALRAVQNGTVSLSSVHLPTRLMPHIYRRPTSGVEWKELSLPCVSEGEWLGDAGQPVDERVAWLVEERRVRDGIREALSELDCRLDFGSYGAIMLRRDRTVSPPRDQIMLPPVLRERIRWLLSLGPPVGTCAPGDMVRGLDQSLPSDIYHSLNERDKALLRLLRERGRWPRTAEPHLRALVNDLQRVFCEAKARRSLAPTAGVRVARGGIL